MTRWRLAIQTTVRWTARGTALIWLGLVVLMIFGNSIELSRLSVRDGILMLLFASICVGFAVGWRWERIGGGLALAALVGFYLCHYAFSGRWPTGWAFPTMAIPPILYLAGAALENGCVSKLPPANRA